MFWGLIMEPERRYTQKVKKPFHISMASMDISTSGDEPSQVMCGFDGRNYLLCTLAKPNTIQCPLDLEFSEGTEVSFAANGKAHIHLTGYLTDTDDLDNLEDLVEEQDEEEVEEVEEKQKPGKKKKKTLENGPPAKKAKINGWKQDSKDSDEDDDSDDAGNEEVEDEEESNEEDAEDEESGEGEEDSEDDDDDDDNDEEVEEEEEKPKVVSNKKQKAREAAKQQPMVNGEKKKEPKKTEQQKPAPKKVKLDQGVVIEDLKVGDGPKAANGKFVSVYYEGRLEKTGKVFDSNNKGPGFKFKLGKQEVIKGWDLGVAGMKVGGKRKIVCPPNVAYGARGSPPVIPPNSTLVFTVELKKVQ